MGSIVNSFRAIDFDQNNSGNIETRMSQSFEINSTSLEENDQNSYTGHNNKDNHERDEHFKTSAEITDNNVNNSILDLDTNIIESLVTENIINLDSDSDDTVNPFPEQSQTDFESLLEVNRISKNDLIEPIFNLDDFYRMCVYDRYSEVDEKEFTNTNMVTHIDDSALDTHHTKILAKLDGENQKGDTNEKSIKEFEDILRSFGTKMARVSDLNKGNTGEISGVSDTSCLFEVPIEFEINRKVNLKEDIILIDSNSECEDNNDSADISEHPKTNTQENSIILIGSNLHKDGLTSDKNIDSNENFPLLIDSVSEVKSFDGNKDLAGDTNVDTIENTTFEESDSECAGYHSSDFEFITEEEAKLAGLIANRPNRKQKNSTKRLKNPTSPPSKCKESSKEYANVAGPSKINERLPKNMLKYWSRNYNRSLRVEQYFTDMKNNKENHEIPQGEAYLNLFQGIHASTNVFLENKSVILSACMTIEDVNFNEVNIMKNQEVVNKQLQEAKENEKKILERYPGENRKKRRRL